MYLSTVLKRETKVRGRLQEERRRFLYPYRGSGPFEGKCLFYPEVLFVSGFQNWRRKRRVGREGGRKRFLISTLLDLRFECYPETGWALPLF